jgi:hypothetical protein
MKYGWSKVPKKCCVQYKLKNVYKLNIGVCVEWDYAFVKPKVGEYLLKGRAWGRKPLPNR